MKYKSNNRLKLLFIDSPPFSVHSAPKSGKWKSNGSLNCRGTTSPGPMEAIFFGPYVSGSAKCGGGSSSRLTHARQIHREICALLLGALESLRMNLFEFCTVLPAQWATLTGSTQTVSSTETEQRLNKLIESAKVRKRKSSPSSREVKMIFLAGTRQRRRLRCQGELRRCATLR